jgi:hypothetical protein
MLHIGETSIDITFSLNKPVIIDAWAQNVLPLLKDIPPCGNQQGDDFIATVSADTNMFDLVSPAKVITSCNDHKGCIGIVSLMTGPKDSCTLTNGFHTVGGVVVAEPMFEAAAKTTKYHSLLECKKARHGRCELCKGLLKQLMREDPMILAIKKFLVDAKLVGYESSPSIWWRTDGFGSFDDRTIGCSKDPHGCDCTDSADWSTQRFVGLWIETLPDALGIPQHQVHTRPTDETAPSSQFLRWAGRIAQLQGFPSKCSALLPESFCSEMKNEPKL